LSLGTPVISERTEQTRPHAAFEDSVFWLEGDQLEQFFAQDFGTADYYDVARTALQRFEAADPIEAYANLLAFAVGFGGAHHARRPAEAWLPERINLGSGRDYQPGWLNLDVLERAAPDLLLDLSHPLALPLITSTSNAGPLRLEAGSVQTIKANNVLEHVADLATLMGNCLALLASGGEFHIEVPYEHAPTAWQDPTHVRAMNENSWLYYTEWFWYLGWFEYRFVVTASTYLDAQLKECGREQASFMKLVLTKTETTLQERMSARTLQSELLLPDDVVDAHHVYRPAMAIAA
jgi:SAM-dependent methyltransferase